MKKKKYPFYLTVCAITKNEGPYLQEWIEYHNMLGVEKFYLYDNESADNTRDVLQPYIDKGLVEYTFFPGMKMQLKAYKDCVKKHKRDTRYMAFIDIDEFIVPIKHNTIPDYLDSLGKISAVQMNWIVYGSGGAKTRTEGFVIERFRDHSLPDNPLNHHIKTIANPRRIVTFFSAHRPLIILGKVVDSNGKRVTKSFWKRPPVTSAIRVNHYAIKSYEEFLEKRSRGRARFNRIRGLDYFEKYDKNEIKSDPIMEKYVVELKKLIR
ncbi:MAG: glycosyltransferase family 92 protein [Cyclobacteriaceae bacterium]|nr:glycosyltransferase family 92 protein [Cyclobacteriaceae bacterium]